MLSELKNFVPFVRFVVLVRNPSSYPEQLNRQEGFSQSSQSARSSQTNNAYSSIRLGGVPQGLKFESQLSFSFL
jgi:hypothetical protein